MLDKKSLNRALLERQLLLKRVKMSAYNAIDHLAGIQSQAPNSAYFALWTRLLDFRKEELINLINDRSVVRIAMMRSTLHLVTDRYCLEYRSLLQPVLERSLKGNFGKFLKGIDTNELITAGREILEQESRTLNELGKLLKEYWPDRDPFALANAIRNLLPLVQVPPRGLWGKSGAAVHTTAETWLGKSLSENTSLDEMIIRYLGAFGPASVKDIQVWSGLTGIREVIDKLRPGLFTFYDEGGNELFDLPDSPRPDKDTPAPPRYLSEFDNILLSHADRTRIIAKEYEELVFTKNGIIRATVLVDGFVQGIWKIVKQANTATLNIELFQPISKENHKALLVEGQDLLQFAAPDFAEHHIRCVVKD
jgi:hypothetical protein